MEHAPGSDARNHGARHALARSRSCGHGSRAFDPRRFGRFLRFELLTRRSDFLLPLAIPVALFLLGRILDALQGDPLTAFPSGLFSFGLALGVGAAMNAHRADKDTATAALHVMLPATAFEKFAARWVLSFGLTYVANWLLLTLLSSAQGLFLLARQGSFPAELLPAPSEWLRGAAWYLPVHAVFFLGGAVFRGNVFFKTVSSVAAYGIALALLAALLGSWGLGEGAWMKVLAFVAAAAPDSAPDPAGAGADVALLLVRAAFSILLPLFLYTAAYFRTVEHEVR